MDGLENGHSSSIRIMRLHHKYWELHKSHSRKFRQSVRHFHESTTNLVLFLDTFLRCILYVFEKYCFKEPNRSPISFKYIPMYKKNVQLTNEVSYLKLLFDGTMCFIHLNVKYLLSRVEMRISWIWDQFHLSKNN